MNYVALISGISDDEGRKPGKMRAKIVKVRPGKIIIFWITISIEMIDNVA